MKIMPSGDQLSCYVAGTLALLGSITGTAAFAHDISAWIEPNYGYNKANTSQINNPIALFSQTLLQMMALDHPQTKILISQQSQLMNQISIEERGGYRYISSNGIPDHAPGNFPNAGNPNSISAQNHRFRVTLTPQLTETSTPTRPAFGVALNGVPFEPGTAEYWNRERTSGWNYDALSGRINLGLDQHNAHVQPSGSYHYHGLPTGLLQGTSMTLVGYAADGFPVYGQYGYRDINNSTSGLTSLQSSYRLKAGQRPNGPGGTYDGTFVQDFEYVAGLGDLDECNGRFGVTPEHPNGIYHYHITEMFPFIPRCVKGTPDQSFQRRFVNSSPSGDVRPAGRPPFPPPSNRAR